MNDLTSGADLRCITDHLSFFVFFFFFFYGVLVVGNPPCIPNAIVVAIHAATEVELRSDTGCTTIPYGLGFRSLRVYRV